MGILFKNGKHLDKNGRLVDVDVYVEDGKIRAIDSPQRVEGALSGNAEVVDLRGKLVLPGLIDMHVHLREPGFEGKETIRTGTLAAAKGGFTTVACMPNTRPVTDNAELVAWIRRKAAEEGSVRVLPIAAITVREKGEELTDFAALKKAGAVGLSDDGVGVQNSRLMKEAMEKAAALGLPIIAHCEDDALARGGVVHAGSFAQKYGLKGIPGEAEAVQIARDIVLAEATGVHYHVCHISSAQSVRLVREAKARGLKVTAEVTPHHLLLCDEDIPGLDANFKMNPPLRGREDRQALLEGLRDGTIDIIATDHAPHTDEEKAKGMERAPFGVVGLETAFPLLYTHLVLQGIITLRELIDSLTRKPAELFGLSGGKLEPGAAADLTVVDLEEERTVDPEEFASKGKNTPFAGWKLKGWPVLTAVGGRIVWRADAL
ncbi:dihydroorotase [Bacillaceae bacterium]